MHIQDRYCSRDHPPHRQRARQAPRPPRPGQGARSEGAGTVDDRVGKGRGHGTYGFIILLTLYHFFRFIFVLLLVTTAQHFNPTRHGGAKRSTRVEGTWPQSLPTRPPPAASSFYFAFPPFSYGFIHIQY